MNTSKIADYVTAISGPSQRLHQQTRTLYKEDGTSVLYTEDDVYRYDASGQLSGMTTTTTLDGTTTTRNSNTGYVHGDPTGTAGLDDRIYQYSENGVDWTLKYDAEGRVTKRKSSLPVPHVGQFAVTERDGESPVGRPRPLDFDRLGLQEKRHRDRDDERGIRLRGVKFGVILC